METGTSETSDLFLAPPQYRLELVFQEDEGRQILKKKLLADGCPGKCYEDDLEVELNPKSGLAMQLNAMYLESNL